MAQTGKLQLILQTDKEFPLKLETDILMDINEEQNVAFSFLFDFSEYSGKGMVYIDGDGKSNKIFQPYGVQIVEDEGNGFTLLFSLADEANEDGSLFICAARFSHPLPVKGFIQNLLYHFKF